MSVVLYTNHCPCCEVLETKLKAAGIQYRTVDDVRLMLEMGLTTMPMLETNDMMMNYPAALKWLAEEVDVPVIVVGGFRALDTMEAALNRTKVALISLSRPLLCEPDLPKRMQAAPQTVSRCVSCNRCYSSDAHKCVIRKHLK